MPSDFIQRQIDGLLEQASQALQRFDWSTVRQSAAAVLGLDAENPDAKTLLGLADGQQDGGFPFPGEKRAAVGAGLRPALPDQQRDPDAAPVPTSPEPLRNPPPRGEGTTIPTSFANGRYTVKRFLGEGGKKRVYLAHDTTLDRDVAFALIKTDGLDDTARERISREAQAMGRLGSHPHIVTVFDLGTEPPTGSRQQATGDAGPLSLAGEGEGEGEGQASAHTRAAPNRGQPYMVTELMAGGDVEALIEQARNDPSVGARHAVPLTVALAIAEQVCQGLEFAHNKGIVHRDLKPGNVWLAESLQPSAISHQQGSTPSLSLVGEGQGEGEGQSRIHAQALATLTAKIGDFGLAVAIDRTRLTQAGMMVGTVSYMPPEQATGGEVTPRSDLYSLGAMLYELVTGRPPFVGDEAVAIIGQHLNTPPVAPTWHRPDCPPGLEALILRLLEKDPSKRPASASEVREALEHVQVGLASDSTRARRASLSLAGEGQGEGEAQAAADDRAALDNPLYRRVFVGREAEVRQLQAAFDAALSGKGALAMVVGEPGIGKTAVCEQLATYVTLRGGTTLTGHCYEEGSLSLPYLAFVEALRSYAISRPPEALRAELGTAASDVARIVSEVRERLAVEPRPPGDPEEDRWRLLQAVSGFLRSASAVQPLLLVLEDLHWADQGTLDLLQHLARNLAGARLLVIGTYRDVEVDRSHPLSATLAELRRGQEFGRVLLRGLGTPEVQRMLLAITGAEVPGSLAESIHRQTEGNPLFVQEVVRYLVEEGHLGHGSILPSPHRGGAGGEVTAAAMSIPEGLRDVIGRRLSRLSLDCNRVLAVAAVIGRDFGLETLHTVIELDEEQVVSSLEEALKIGVLEEQSRPGSIRYRFAHAFFRQTLYEELIAPRRLRLHQQVAAALESQYKNRLEEHAAELAEHFAQSTDRDDLAKAVRYGELGAKRALAVYAYGEAVRHLEQALAVQEVLDPDDTAKRCDLVLALGEALVSAGEGTRAVEQVAPEALRLAQSLGDRRRASRACRSVQEASRRSTALQLSAGARKWSDLADQYAEEGSVDRVYADVSLAINARIGGNAAECHRLQRRAWLLAQVLGDPRAVARGSELLLSGTACAPEEHNERIALAEELSKYSTEGVDGATMASALLARGEAYLTWGRRDEAEHYWLQAREIAARSRDATAAFIALQIDAILATLDGKLEQVLDLGAQIQVRGVEVGREQSGRQISARIVRRPLIYLGRANDALPGILGSTQLLLQGGVFSGQRAVCLAHEGQIEEAREILRKMLSESGTNPSVGSLSATVLRYLLETAVLVQDADACRLLGAQMAPLAGLLHTEAEMCYNIGRLLGGAASLLGETEEARGYYQQAIEICEKVRFRPELALTRLELAELMLGEIRAGETPAPPEAQRAEALAHLDFAIAEFREMKMQPSLERALRHKEVLKA